MSGLILGSFWCRLTAPSQSQNGTISFPKMPSGTVKFFPKGQSGTVKFFPKGQLGTVKVFPKWFWRLYNLTLFNALLLKFRNHEVKVDSSKFFIRDRNCFTINPPKYSGNPKLYTPDLTVIKVAISFLRSQTLGLF